MWVRTVTMTKIKTKTETKIQAMTIVTGGIETDKKQEKSQGKQLL